MAASFLKSRQTRYTAYATTYILVILAVLGAVNFLANRYDKSYDSTSNKQFSLSDQTIKFVGNLKNDIKLTYFDEATRFPQARDLLDRYTALSPKLKVEFIDPVKKPQQAKSAGYRRDVTILVDSGARKEEAKSLTEEEVTGAHHPLPEIRRAQRLLRQCGQRALHRRRSRHRLLADEAAAGARQLQDPHHRFQTQGRRTRQAASPSARPRSSRAVEVPKDCLVLVVGGPQLAYPQPIVDAFKKYVEGGGHALFMLDNVAEDRPRRTAGRKPRTGRAAHRVGRHCRIRTWCWISAASAICSAPVPKSRSSCSTNRTPDYASPGARAHRLPRAALARCQVRRQEHGREALRHHRGQHRRHRGRRQRRQSIPRRARRDRSRSAPPAPCRALPAGRFIVVGTSQWAENRAMGSRTPGQSRSVHEHDQLAQRRRRPDQHPSEIHRRSPAHPDRAEAQPGVLAERRDLPAGHRRHGPGHLVEEEISDEAEGTPHCRRSFGCSGRADLVE